MPDVLLCAFGRFFRVTTPRQRYKFVFVEQKGYGTKDTKVIDRFNPG